MSDIQCSDFNTKFKSEDIIVWVRSLYTLLWLKYILHLMNYADIYFRKVSRGDKAEQHDTEETTESVEEVPSDSDLR